MEDSYEDSYDEYGDQDAIDCARGDYNVAEEREIFLDECRDREDWFEDCDDDGCWDEMPDRDYDDFDDYRDSFYD